MKIAKKFAALAIAGALIASAFGGAQAAQAAAIPVTGGVTPAITITPTSGNVNTDTVFLNSLSVNVGGPAGYQIASGMFAFQNGVNMGSLANMRTPGISAQSYGTFGLDGNSSFADRSISATNNYVSNKLLNGTNTALVSGAFELRNYYFASTTSQNLAADPYVSLSMTYDATTGAWSVVLPVAPATATTVSLSASATGNTVNLSATVKAPDSSTATAAAGNIVFAEGSTTVATVAVATGLASATLTSVTSGAHTYTAQFVSSNTIYSGSTSSASTVYPGGQQALTTTSVTMPGGVGALSLTGVSSSVVLGTAVLNATTNTLDASGILNAVVTDSRQTDAPSWNLTGQVGDFTAGAKTISGTYLGWTPSVSAGSIGTAGAVVLPASTTGNGLKSISPLSAGAPSAAGNTTTVSALLLLKAPAKTPAGTYSAILTLTLI